MRGGGDWSDVLDLIGVVMHRFTHLSQLTKLEMGALILLYINYTPIKSIKRVVKLTKIQNYYIEHN